MRVLNGTSTMNSRRPLLSQIMMLSTREMCSNCDTWTIHMRHSSTKLSAKLTKSIHSPSSAAHSSPSVDTASNVSS